MKPSTRNIVVLATLATVPVIVPVIAPNLVFARKTPSLPAAVLAARTIYIDNQTSDAGLQNNAYMALAKWGRFQVADVPQKADIVLRLTGSNYVQSVPSDTPPQMPAASPASRAGRGTTPAPSEASGAALLPNGYEPAPDGFTRLTLLDAKTGAAVWSDLSKTNSPQAATHILDGLREAFEQSQKAR